MEGPEIKAVEAVIDNGTFGKRTLRFETGRLAQQADGAVAAYLDDDSMILSTTTAGSSPKENYDFFPLTVDVEEKMYAAGKIPGSFFRREGRYYGGFDWGFSSRMLAEFGILPGVMYGALSLGQRMIVRLVAALCVPVDVLLLDEPVIGLDAANRQLFYRFLLESYNDRPRTIVVSTHIIDEIAHVVERVAILDRGRIVDEFTAESVGSRATALVGDAERVMRFVEECGLRVISREDMGRPAAGPRPSGRPWAQGGGGGAENPAPKAGKTAARSPFRRSSIVVGGAIVLFFVLLAVLAGPLSAITGNDPYAEHPEALGAGSAPAGFGGGISARHWFGVTPLRGVDLFSIVAYGSPVSPA